MTSEERLNRVERIARLMVRVGLRARRHSREQDDKIDIIIDAQIKNEERFAKLANNHAELAQTQGDKINIMIASQIRSDERFAKLADNHAELTRTQAQQSDKISILSAAQTKNEERFAKMAEAHIELAQAQAHTDRRLDALIDIIREGRNGKPDS